MDKMIEAHNAVFGFEIIEGKIRPPKYQLPISVKERIKYIGEESQNGMTFLGCMYCKHGEPLNDTSNSNFTTAIECEENGYYIATEYDDGDYADTGYSAYIQYCPICGRKLEAE